MSMAQLAKDPVFQDRVRAAATIECQQNLDNPDRADLSNLAYDTLRNADHTMESFVRLVAAIPSIADTAGDPPDQSLITDGQLADAIDECYPTVASLWYMPDGNGWIHASHPPVEPPPPVEPTVTGVDPTSGGKGTPITLTGSGLTGTTKITIDTRNCTSLSVIDDTQVTALTPAGSGGQLVSPGTYPIIVTVSGADYIGPHFQVI